MNGLKSRLLDPATRVIRASRATGGSASPDRLRHTQLRHQPGYVNEAPMVSEPAVAHSAGIHDGDRDPAACGWDA